MIKKTIIIAFICFICGSLLAEDISPSGKMLNNFRNVSTELCLSILELAQADDESGKSWLEKVKGETLKQKSENLTSEIMKQWANGFVVSDTEALELLSEKYNDEQNRQDVKDCISGFAKQKVPLPLIFQHLISKFHKGELKSGILLEFTTRLFKEHLKQIKR